MIEEGFFFFFLSGSCLESLKPILVEKAQPQPSEASGQNSSAVGKQGEVGADVQQFLLFTRYNSV